MTLADALRIADGDLPAEMSEWCKACLVLAQEVRSRQWQPIESHDGSRQEALFWIVPLQPDEQPLFEEGDKPIPLSDLKPARVSMGTIGTWSCLFKATNWQPLPAAPVTLNERNDNPARRIDGTIDELLA
jgi:hypothetical protein